VDAVGITNQRASTIVWDAATGEPIGPGIGWQDLRTVFRCLELAGSGLRLAPNQSATKLESLLQTVAPSEREHLRFGTVDTWVASVLSGGALHVTDASNAAVTGLLTPDAADWDEAVLDALGIPEKVLPSVVDSTGVMGTASALPGAPPIAGMAGDQQASLVGQGCITPGAVKITFGTGGMLDVCLGDARPAFTVQGPAGTFPIVAWRDHGHVTWGIEATMLSAGTCVEWLRDELRIIDAASECDAIARQCADSGDVWFVPALFGLGTPLWDYGARGTLLGLTRGSGRPQIVRAVLEGVAHRGIDLVEAAEADADMRFTTVRIDGGMSASDVFVQALADAGGRRVEIAPVVEATTLGAGFLAGVAVGVWPSLASTAALLKPRAVVEPRAQLDRDRWRDLRSRALRTVPALSDVHF
jgi:glycerol kinase